MMPMTIVKRVLTSLMYLTLPLLLSCATQDLNEVGAFVDTKPSSGSAAVSQGADAGNSGQSPDSAEDEGRGSIFIGTDQGVRMPPAREPIKVYGDAVTLNFEEAPLSEVVHSIVGDLLGLDYIVEHPVKGAVTLRTRSPIPRDELLPILESLLHNHGALLVRGPNNRLFISGAQNASRMAPAFRVLRGWHWVFQCHRAAAVYCCD
jgi:general secretion pathway protein D